MSVSSLPKYAKAKQSILGYIGKEGVKVGERLPSEKELCAHFDVSIITLRRALQELAIEGVVDRVQGKGTFVKSFISSGKKMGDILFLGIDSWTYPSSVQLKELHEDLSRRGHGLRYLITRATPDHDILQEVVKTRGVLFSGWVTDEWVTFLKNCSVPSIVIGAYPLSQNICTVKYNWAKAAEILVDHFAAQGLTRIGLINSDRKFYPGHEILHGYKAAMEKLNLPYTDDNIAWPADELRFQETSEFILQRNDSLDAIIVQEGRSFPLLTCFWENGNLRQPNIGIIGEDTFVPSQCAKVVGTCFQRTALQSSVDLLFNMLDAEGFNDQVVNIEPLLSIHNTNHAMGDNAE